MTDPSPAMIPERPRFSTAVILSGHNPSTVPLLVEPCPGQDIKRPTWLLYAVARASNAHERRSTCVTIPVSRIKDLPDYYDHDNNDARLRRQRQRTDCRSPQPNCYEGKRFTNYLNGRGPGSHEHPNHTQAKRSVSSHANSPSLANSPCPRIFHDPLSLLSSDTRRGLPLCLRTSQYPHGGQNTRLTT